MCQAIRGDDAAAVRSLFQQHPGLKAKINARVGDFGSPAIVHARSAAMLDALLEAGADINARSEWGPGGFGLLDSASPELSAHAISRGAILTAHAAARLGMFDKLKDLVAANPAVVHEKGGDGKRPLHWASTIEIAGFLLERGADIDARCVDHESTAAQYLMKSHPEVARHLIERGAKTDILMAAALGDAALADKLLAADPECIRTRVADEYFPMVGSAANGGTIYQWELGWYVSACQVAKSFGHADLFDRLMARCPADEKLLNACWLHDDEMVASLLAVDPKVAERMPPSGRRHVAHAARNNDIAAARLMLKSGMPVDASSQHGGTALHWAAWQGNADLVRLLLDHGASITNTENQYQGTPLNWATHGSENGWHKGKGDHKTVIAELKSRGTA